MKNYLKVVFVLIFMMLIPYYFIGEFYGIVHFCLLAPWSLIVEKIYGMSSDNYFIIFFLTVVNCSLFALVLTPFFIWFKKLIKKVINNHIVIQQKPSLEVPPKYFKYVKKTWK